MGELHLNNWIHFMQVANALHVGPATSIPYVFRGQSDAGWELEPSLLRVLKKKNLSSEQALLIEKNALEEFQSQAHLHISPNVLSSTTDTLSWWTLMQHHGAPTRLLDWSQSIYAAAYFAVIDNPEKDGAVWLVHVSSVIEKMKSTFQNYSMPITKAETRTKFLGANSPDELYIFGRKRKSERMVAQQGIFSICRNINSSHSDVLSKVFPSQEGKEVYRKLVIPFDQKNEYLTKLRSMNVTASSLFPGLDGVGKSICEFIQLS